MSEQFHKIAQYVSKLSGTSGAFMIALAVILVWALCGRAFGYSDTWQLVINTSTTIITFLMVFLIQNTQNRDSRATQLKLDELIRANKGARNRLINLEDMSEAELDRVHQEFCALQSTFTDEIEHIAQVRAKKKNRHHAKNRPGPLRS